MRTSFPSAPDGYFLVIGVRLLLVAGVLLGIRLVVWRVRQWNSIDSDEIVSWAIGGGIGLLTGLLGFCHETEFDGNQWQIPLLTGVFAVSASGVAIGLCKNYLDSSDSDKRLFHVTFVIAFLCAQVLVGPLLDWLIVQHGLRDLGSDIPYGRRPL